MEFKKGQSFVDQVNVMKRSNNIPTSIVLEGLNMRFYFPLTVKGNDLTGKTVESDSFQAKVTIKSVKDNLPSLIHVARIDSIYALSAVLPAKKKKRKISDEAKKRKNKQRKERRKRLRELKLKENDQILKEGV